ncbi:hypothetical protein ACN38_g8459 [Penicillium nordicum]|uniref:Uncharacterized protein n=1 Tax=Penicillium nordicum TaxID=229535 RepID=A0A0M8NX71_9EURO|nr:hypothetical protein ACN38_g8459 [Penicillium nordicum]
MSNLHRPSLCLVISFAEYIPRGTQHELDAVTELSRVITLHDNIVLTIWRRFEKSVPTRGALVMHDDPHSYLSLESSSLIGFSYYIC